VSGKNGTSRSTFVDGEKIVKMPKEGSTSADPTDGGGGKGNQERGRMSQGKGKTVLKKIGGGQGQVPVNVPKPPTWNLRKKKKKGGRKIGKMS